MSTVVVLDRDALLRIRDVQAWAVANPRRETDVIAGLLGPDVAGDLVENVVELRPGVRCVYVIDLLISQTGPMRHLSVSLDCGHPPSERIMVQLAELFGFRDPTFGSMRGDPPNVVHAIEPYRGPLGVMN